MGQQMRYLELSLLLVYHTNVKENYLGYKIKSVVWREFIFVPILRGQYLVSRK
jgi:hypothetical protein